jgi:hypothetical protein
VLGQDHWMSVINRSKSCLMKTIDLYTMIVYLETFLR